MNDIKLKPFDLQKCLAGEPVIFRNGEPYKFGAYNPDANENEQILGWDKNGNMCNHKMNGKWVGLNHEHELVMKPQEKELWIIISNKVIGRGCYGLPFNAMDSEARANEIFIESSLNPDEYQIIKITITQ